MKVLLIIALSICGLEILTDIVSICKGGSTNLLLHIFYEVAFAIALAQFC